MGADLAAAVDRLFPEVRADLERLVRMPSVSAEGPESPALLGCAEAVAALFGRAGLDTRLLEVDGAPPAVFGERAAAPGKPTVLLYAHYDVQPAGDASLWRSPPFEPLERDGRLYGRGASDDKSGIAAHLGALRALGESLAVGVKVLVEGEEELGSPHMAELLARHGERLAADVIVVADGEHWRVGQPALTASLRGLIDCVVEVRTLKQGVHSGVFGGAVPDALTALARLLATLHDEHGRPAVRGLASAEPPGVQTSEEDLREHAGVLEGVELIGSGPLTARLWAQPAISVLAIDAPAVRDAINQLVPVARAKVSVRLAPGDDPSRAMRALVAHLETHAPWGARVTVTPGAQAAPFRAASTGRAREAFARAYEQAWGRAPVAIGLGGSIPLVPALQAAYPDAELLITGVGEPGSHIHGPDESQDLGELRRNVLAEALALDALASS